MEPVVSTTDACQTLIGSSSNSMLSVKEAYGQDLVASPIFYESSIQREGKDCIEKEEVISPEIAEETVDYNNKNECITHHKGTMNQPTVFFNKAVKIYQSSLKDIQIHQLSDQLSEGEIEDSDEFCPIGKQSLNSSQSYNKQDEELSSQQLHYDEFSSVSRPKSYPLTPFNQSFSLSSTAFRNQTTSVCPSFIMNQGIHPFDYLPYRDSGNRQSLGYTDRESGKCKLSSNRERIISEDFMGKQLCVTSASSSSRDSSVGSTLLPVDTFNSKSSSITQADRYISCSSSSRHVLQNSNRHLFDCQADTVITIHRIVLTLLWPSLDAQSLIHLLKFDCPPLKIQLFWYGTRRALRLDFSSVLEVSNALRRCEMLLSCYESDVGTKGMVCRFPFIISSVTEVPRLQQSYTLRRKIPVEIEKITNDTAVSTISIKECEKSKDSSPPRQLPLTTPDYHASSNQRQTFNRSDDHYDGIIGTEADKTNIIKPITSTDNKQDTTLMYSEQDINCSDKLHNETSTAANKPFVQHGTEFGVSTSKILKHDHPNIQTCHIPPHYEVANLFPEQWPPLHRKPYSSLFYDQLCVQPKLRPFRPLHTTGAPFKSFKLKPVSFWCEHATIEEQIEDYRQLVSRFGFTNRYVLMKQLPSTLLDASSVEAFFKKMTNNEEDLEIEMIDIMNQNTNTPTKSPAAHLSFKTKRAAQLVVRQLQHALESASPPFNSIDIEFTGPRKSNYTLWIGNLRDFTAKSPSAYAFTSLLRQFGRVHRMKFIPEKSCAFVEYESLEFAKYARNHLHGIFFGFPGQQMQLNVDFSAGEFGTTRKQDTELNYSTFNCYFCHLRVRRLDQLSPPSNKTFHHPLDIPTPITPTRTTYISDVGYSSTDHDTTSIPRFPLLIISPEISGYIHPSSYEEIISESFEQPDMIRSSISSPGNLRRTGLFNTHNDDNSHRLNTISGSYPTQRNVLYHPVCLKANDNLMIKDHCDCPVHHHIMNTSCVPVSPHLISSDPTIQGDDVTELHNDMSVLQQHQQQKKNFYYDETPHLSHIDSVQHCHPDVCDQHDIHLSENLKSMESSSVIQTHDMYPLESEHFSAINSQRHHPCDDTIPLSLENDSKMKLRDFKNKHHPISTIKHPPPPPPSSSLLSIKNDQQKLHSSYSLMHVSHPYHDDNKRPNSTFQRHLSHRIKDHKFNRFTRSTKDVSHSYHSRPYITQSRSHSVHSSSCSKTIQKRSHIRYDHKDSRRSNTRPERCNTRSNEKDHSYHRLHMSQHKKYVYKKRIRSRHSISSSWSSTSIPSSNDISRYKEAIVTHSIPTIRSHPTAQSFKTQFNEIHLHEQLLPSDKKTHKPQDSYDNARHHTHPIKMSLNPRDSIEKTTFSQNDAYTTHVTNNIPTDLNERAMNDDTTTNKRVLSESQYQDTNEVVSTITTKKLKFHENVHQSYIKDTSPNRSIDVSETSHDQLADISLKTNEIIVSDFNSTTHTMCVGSLEVPENNQTTDHMIYCPINKTQCLPTDHCMITETLGLQQVISSKCKMQSLPLSSMIQPKTIDNILATTTTDIPVATNQCKLFKQGQYLCHTNYILERGQPSLCLPHTLDIETRTTTEKLKLKIEKRSSTSSYTIWKLSPSNPIDQDPYIGFYDYFKSRHRIGFLETDTLTIFIVPLEPDNSISFQLTVAEVTLFAFVFNRRLNHSTATLQT